MYSLLFSAVFALTPDGAPPDSAARETNRLHGEWFLMQTCDAKRAEAGSERIRMTISADGDAVFTFNGLVTNRGQLRILPGGKEQRADLVFADGRTFKGLFVLKGRCLVLCFGEADQGRPTSAEPHGSQWSEHWQQVPHGCLASRPKAR
jgi:hypothetical protein